MRNLILRSSAVALGFAGFAIEFGLPSTQALAQDQTGGVQLEEIIVTARRKDESIMKVPLAITAFTSQDIESRGLSRLEDLSNITPGFFSTETGGTGDFNRRDQQITFRGFSNSSGLFFLDGAPLTVTTFPEFADMERIEVLKGPQSAYFGRSTFSGALNFITKLPGDKFKGNVSAAVGSYDSMDAIASVEGPLIANRFNARFTAHHKFAGGQYHNYADPGQVFGQEASDSLSLVTSFTPTDRLRISTYLTYVATHDGPPAKMALKQPDMNCNLGGRNGPWFCGTIPNADQVPASYISGNYTINAYARSVILDNSSNYITIFDPHYIGGDALHKDAISGNIKIGYDFASGYTLSAVTAYNWEKSQVLRDITERDGRNQPNANPAAATNPNLLPYTWWFFTSQHKNHDFSQEVRLSSSQDKRLRWLLGLSYMDIRLPPTSDLYGISPFGPISGSSSIQTGSKTPAGFGGLYFDLTPKLTLGAELRYQHDSIMQQALANSSGRPIPGGGPVLKASYNSVAPRVTLDYKYNDAGMVYGLWSRGFRPGGFNASLAVAEQSVLDQLAVFGGKVAYDQEQLDNYEIGLKSTWLDNRLRTRLALYYEKWTQGQVSSSAIFRTPEGGVNIFGIVQNLGAINLSGAEFEAEYRISRRLTLSGTFGHAKSDIKSFGICSDCLQIRGTTSATGNQLPAAPRYTWALSAEQTIPIADSQEWFGRLDYSHRGESYITVANVATVPSRDLLNLRVGWRSDTLTLEGFVKNLTDARQFEAATKGAEALFTLASFSQEIRALLPKKREFGVQASYKF